MRLMPEGKQSQICLKNAIFEFEKMLERAI